MILNQSIDEKAAGRKEKADEVIAQLTPMAETPMVAFEAAFEKAHEELCKSEGLGRTYGQPRRNAQNTLRTLTSKVSEAMFALEKYADYMHQRCSRALEAQKNFWSYGRLRCPIFAGPSTLAKTMNILCFG